MEPNNLKPAKILIVDDNQINRTVLSRILKKRNFQSALAADGLEAIEMVEDLAPDLILLDIMMPHLDGFETCRRLKATEIGRQIPIIFVTALTQSQNIEKAFAAGGTDYISKPFVTEEILARVDLHLNLKRANEELVDTLEALKKSRDDLLSVLDLLQVGTIIIESDERISFISESCYIIKGLDKDRILGEKWDHVLPFSEPSKNKLRQQIELSPSERSRITLKIETPTKERFWMDVDVKADPRLPDRSIICLYDITEVHQLRDQVQKSDYVQMIGNSPPMLKMYQTLEQVAKGDWTVLIEGETGSGKELVARSIHATSDRKNGPFIAVNCAGLNESLLASQLFGHRRGSFTGAVSDQDGFFEAAENGSLFLDEIGDIPLSMQASLLRALQEREIIRIGDTKPRKINVRILTATNRDLGKLVEQGLFRQDLLYRIRVARIKIPPLRDRIGDIPLLLDTFLAERRIAMGKPAIKFGQDAMKLLNKYTWPGNVRELKNTVDHCIIHTHQSIITQADLPEEMKQTSFPGRLDTHPSDLTSHIGDSDEKSTLLSALARANGNRTKAAKILGISRATFYRKLEYHQIDPNITE